jgi:hypothetical protein
MDQMLAVLLDHNIIGEAQRPEQNRRGRTASEYQVNPRVHSH